jgi:hypothetical protein
MLLRIPIDPGNYQPPIQAIDTDMGYTSVEFRGSEALLEKQSRNSAEVPAIVAHIGRDGMKSRNTA